MPRWAIAFFVLAATSGFLGLAGLHEDLEFIARLLAVVFSSLFVAAIFLERPRPQAG